MEQQLNQMKKRRMTGVVTSDAMNKTRVITVTRDKKHAKYQRYFTVARRFQAHDEKNEYHAGDRVIIEETRPMSRHKRWVIVAKAGDAPRASYMP